MATRLDDAKIKITLDTSDAERRLDELTKKTTTTKEGMRRIDRPTGPGALRREGPTSTGAVGSLANVGFVKELEAKSQLDPVSGGLLWVAATRGISALGKAGGAALAVKLGYEIFKHTTAWMSEALEALRRSLPDFLANNEAIKGYIYSVIQQRAFLTEKAAQVKTAIESGLASTEFVAEAYRLTGRIPDVGFVFEMDWKTKSRELQMLNGFDRIKGVERKSATLEWMTETLKRSMF